MTKRLVSLGLAYCALFAVGAGYAYESMTWGAAGMGLAVAAIALAVDWRRGEKMRAIRKKSRVERRRK